jgi:hypothetical protein
VPIAVLCGVALLLVAHASEITTLSCTVGDVSGCGQPGFTLVFADAGFGGADASYEYDVTVYLEFLEFSDSNFEPGILVNCFVDSSIQDQGYGETVPLCLETIQHQLQLLLLVVAVV